MTKHLRFLIVLLMTLVWSAGWAQKVTLDFSKSSNPWKLPASYSQVEKSYSYNGYTISFKYGTEGDGYIFTSYSKQYFLQMGKTGMTLVLPTFDFEVSKIVVEGHSSGNEKVTQNIFVAETPICTETKGTKGTNTYIIPDTYQTKGTVYKLRVTNKNVTKITSIKIYEKETTSTKTPTKVSFPAEYSNKTFTFTEGKLEGFTAPTATETNNVAGTIKYSSNNESAVKVNASTGELSFPGYGEATITATFTPTDAEKYEESSDSYMVVNNNPNVKKVTFIDTIDKGKNKNNTAADEITKEGITIYATKAAFGYDTDYRFYNGSNINISTTVGTITRIEFTSGSALNNLKGNGYTATNDEATWTGNASNVVLTNNSKVAKAGTITVYVSLPSAITLDETAPNNTIEAKALANVTLKRTMAKGVWNTVCLPFDVTYDVAKAAFGNDVKIAELDGSSTGTTLSFKNVTNNVTNNVIKASVPYLIKPTIDAPADGYKFEGVEITEAAVNPTKVKTAGNLYFNGVYNMVDATTEVASGYNAAFLGKGNTVFGAQSGTNMKGFRAYFAIPNSVKASELCVVIDGTATSIKNIDSEVVESNAPVYNLQGQRVDGNNLTPGIYVKAGKKFVVR